MSTTSVNQSVESLFLGDPENNIIVTYNAGTPESVVEAGIGSICVDVTNGVIYVKNSGTGDTGWKLVTQAS